MSQAPTEPAAPPAQSNEQIGRGTKIAAGTGEAVINIGINMPKNFGFIIYNLVMGVDAVLLGIVLAIPRLWDGLIDPIMGNISDNTRSKWGRRKPYMLVGGVMSAVGLALICIPPTFMKEMFSDDVMRGFSLFGDRVSLYFSTLDWMAALYFVFISLTFYTFLTVFSVPYGALTMEMTRDYHERTRIMSFRTTFTYISSITFGWILYATKADWFVELARENGAVDPVKTGEIYGTWAVGGVMAVFLLVAAMVPTLFVKEGSAQIAKKQEKVPILKGLKDTLSIPAFVLIIAAYTLAFFGIIMVIHLGVYIAIYHVHGGGEAGKKDGYLAMSYAQTVAPFVGLFTVFMLNRLSGKIEKKHAWAGCMCISLVGAVLAWFLFSPDVAFYRRDVTVPLIGWELDLYLHPLIIAFVMLFPGLGATLVMSYSMMADVCDLDEMNTGKRREGMFWAVFNWVQKSALSISLLFTGFTLWFAGFNEDESVQTQATVDSMRKWFTFTMCSTFAVAIVLVLLIPLSGKRMTAVRAELEKRHATAS
ncbi:MAG: MFS transporter [Planctomycetota bacterium]